MPLTDIHLIRHIGEPQLLRGIVSDILQRVIDNKAAGLTVLLGLHLLRGLHPAFRLRRRKVKYRRLYLIQPLRHGIDRLLQLIHLRRL